MRADMNTNAMAGGHGGLQASAWVQRWANGIAPDGRVLDLACGNGRHTRLLAAHGYEVWAIDRDAQALAALSGVTRVHPIEADLEDAPWPLAGLRFDGIVVTNYLHRPLFPRLLDALTETGVLIYETFRAGNERFGKPSNPAYLLQPGELLQLVHGRLRVIAYEDGYCSMPGPAMIQRIVACGPMAPAQRPDLAGAASHEGFLPAVPIS
jgi:SAM-dependent methyltransferase